MEVNNENKSDSMKKIEKQSNLKVGNNNMNVHEGTDFILFHFILSFLKNILTIFCFYHLSIRCISEKFYTFKHHCLCQLNASFFFFRKR